MQHIDLWSATKTAVEKYLTALISERTTSAQHIHRQYQNLWQDIGHVIKGGKGFRPYLVVIGYGKLDDAIVPIAAAQEMVHAAVLMHDDIIDQDTVRRNMLNVNGRYLERYQPYLPHHEALHYAYSAGLLAGDALLSEAYLAIAQSSMQADIKMAVAGRLHHSIFEVLGGELLDVEASFISDITYDPMTISRYKTSGYSFVGPLHVGAICRGAPEQDFKLLENFGINAGIGFQLQDDLLGVFGLQTDTGKSNLNDLREGKDTYLIENYSQRLAPGSPERQAFDATFGNLSATDAELAVLKENIETSGARAETEQKIGFYYDQAVAALAGLTHPEQADELTRLVELLRERRG